MPTPAGESEDLAWAGTSTFLTGLGTVWILVPFQSAAEEYVFRGWLLQAVCAQRRSPWVTITPQGTDLRRGPRLGHCLGLRRPPRVRRGDRLADHPYRRAGSRHRPAHPQQPGGDEHRRPFAGAFASDGTAADMDWVTLAIDVPMVRLYAIAVLWVTRRRERAHDTDALGGPNTSPPPPAPQNGAGAHTTGRP